MYGGFRFVNNKKVVDTFAAGRDIFIDPDPG